MPTHSQAQVDQGIGSNQCLSGVQRCVRISNPRDSRINEEGLAEGEARHKETWQDTREERREISL